jgi:phage protein D
MSQTPYLSQCQIRIDGWDAPLELMQDLIEVVVDSSLYLPSMFTIRVNDPDLKWVDDARLDIGKPVEIRMTTVIEGESSSSSTGKLIKGEITGLEPEFSGQGMSSLLVRGYDGSHRLHRGKKTRAFLKQTDSRLAQTIAVEAGLSPSVDATTVTYDYVLQNNQTNMEFLMSRADRIGYRVYVANGTLYFKKGTSTAGAEPALTLGETLTRFQPCYAATHQADKYTVKAWDPKAKAAIESTTSADSSLNQGGMTKTGGTCAQSAFGAASAVLTDQPVTTVDEAKAMASGLSQDVGLAFVEAEGTCYGNPAILAGWSITIKNVGTRFSGKYFVTSATHIYGTGGYETRFSISGRQPNTVSHLLDAGNGHAAGMMHGLVTGLVTNLSDPEDLGRVKVKYAWLGEIESDWIRIATPMAGPGRGFCYLPEINDEVLIAFEHGNVHRPYVVGALWSTTDKPPKPNSEVVSGGKVNERIIKSRSGHTVILDDTDGAEQIIIRDWTGKNEMIIDSSQNSMSINVEGDFSVTAKGKITLSSTKDMELASRANGTVKAQGNLDLQARSNLDLKAQSNLTAEGTSTAKVKGAQLGLEGTSKGELKGLIVSVNGSTMTEIKGGLVKIN